MKTLIAAILIAGSAIAAAPVANADSCDDVHARITAHNNAAVDTSSESAVAAYNQEADRLEADQAAACG